MTHHERAERFVALHQASWFVTTNPWDWGSAMLLAGLGFEVAGQQQRRAFSQGLCDGSLGREATLGHLRDLVDSTPLPLNADLETGIGEALEACEDTVRAAAALGVVGGSIEDAGDRADDPVCPLDLAVVVWVHAAVAEPRPAAALRVDGACRKPKPALAPPRPGRYDPPVADLCRGRRRRTPRARLEDRRRGRQSAPDGGPEAGQCANGPARLDAGFSRAGHDRCAPSQRRLALRSRRLRRTAARGRRRAADRALRLRRMRIGIRRTEHCLPGRWPPDPASGSRRLPPFTGAPR